MSERQPRKPGLVPSPLVLVLFLVSAALVIVGGISLFTTGLSSPPAAQPGAVAAAPATATAVDSEPEPNYDLTPTRVLPPPTNAPLPPGFETPTELPPRTQYVPGPTAQFDTIPPLEEWNSYTNEQADFSLRYPPDWYLKTTEAGQTTQLFSYDYNDPSLSVYKGPLRPNLTGVDIAVSELQWSSDSAFRDGETIRGWILRNRSLGEGDTLLDEEEFTVDGRSAYRRVVQWEGAGVLEGVYVQRENDILVIVHPYNEADSTVEQVFRMIIESIDFP